MGRHFQHIILFMLCLIFACLLQNRISTYEAAIPLNEKPVSVNFNDSLAAETINATHFDEKLGQGLAIDTQRENLYFFEGIAKPNTKKIFKLFQSFHPNDFSK